ncbi:MAG TPA: polysaccharide biosynthesis tyrosine autokinase [Planctomycetota bacterium]|nr:polysaccharide biosynthesis tyrosine autokinase [Planctomycetota bacterium]
MNGPGGSPPADRAQRPAPNRAAPGGESRPVKPFLSPSVDATADLGLRQYLRLFGHHARLMLLVGVLPLIAVTIYTFMQPKRYRTQTVIRREDGREASSGRTPLSPLMTGQGAVRELRTGKLSEAVRRQLADQGTVLPAGEELTRMIQAVPDDRNQELVIAVSDTDPERAAQLANALADALKEKANKGSTEELADRKGFAEKALKAKAAELARTLEKIQEKENQRLGKSREEAAAQTQTASADDIRNQVIRLESRRQESELQEKELAERIARLKKSMAETGVRQPGATSGDLEKSLIRAELALAQAETKYNESHPTYIKLRGERDEIFKILQRKVDERADEPRFSLDELQRSQMLLEAEQAGVQARIKILGQFIAEKTEALRKASPVRAAGTDPELDELLRKQKILEGVVASLQKNAESLEIPEDTLPKWEISTPASAPRRSDYYSPRWAMALAVGFGLALALAMMAAFIAENLEDRIRDQGDLLKNFRLPFLGPVPLRRESEALLIDLDQPKHLMSSIFEVLRNNINYALPPGAPKVVLVASGVVGEGKSTVAANLAISYCLDGNNVLLIDTDLRRPRAHRLFENLCPQALNSAGLAGYLSGRVQLEDVELRTKVNNLSFISAGKGAVNPSKLLGSDEMRKLMDHVSRHYDVVVLDGPAVLPVVDSTVVSQFVSGVVLVVSCKHAPAEQVATAIARLEHVRARIVGMILNRVSSGSRSYGYYYGNRYGYGYGYGYGYHSAYHEDSNERR